MNEFLPEVSKIKYEGPDSTNPLAFKHYNPVEEIEGKTMKEHLRFSVAFWHTFRNGNADPFGAPTRIMPWEYEKDNVKNAKKRAQAAFEFFEKLDVPFYCFHDRDIAPEGDSLKETNDNLEEVSNFFKEEQERTGVQLLWGTSCLFANPRFLHGAGTSCNADVYAYAAAQVAKAMEVTKKLSGKGFVFWGGREGYKTLLNTDMKRELDNYARFLEMAVEYKEKIGFDGQFYIEPKPKEPTKHQYDSDAAACCAFLRKYDLLDHFKLNIEANHATLAGHTFMHELEYSAANDMLGSVDANRGDLMLGWDTDQFPTNLYDTTLGMLTILNSGGFTTGGLNFDAHVTRESFEPVDLFHAHIAGMDTFARGLKAAAALRKDGVLKEFTQNRYASWDSGIGADVEAGKVGFAELSQYMLEKGEPDNNESGRAEMLENILNSYI